MKKRNGCPGFLWDHGRTIDEARGTLARFGENIESAGSSMYGYYMGRHVDQLANGIDYL